MKTENKVGFSLTMDDSGEYRVLAVRIYPDRTYSGSNAIHLRYQETKSEPCKWYGNHVELNCDNVEQLRERVKLLDKLFPRKDKYDEFCIGGSNLLNVLLRLQAKAVECVNDRRVSRLVPVDEVKPSDWKAYRDNWEAVDYADGSSGCTVGCLAPDDDEARRLLTVEFADGRSEYYRNRFAIWLAAGRPVKDLDSYMGFRGPDKFPRAETLIQEILDVRTAEIQSAASANAIENEAS